MREFKFRAWVPDYIPSKEPASMVYSDNVGGVGFFFNNFDGEEIMQFTGLTDKNGGEIYEGDILNNPELPNNDSREVYFDGEFLSWFVNDFDGNIISLYDYFNYQSCTVIGNIHQNPELLK